MNNREDMLAFQCKGYTLLAIVLSLPAFTLDLIHWITK